MFSVLWTTGVIQYRFNCTWCFQHYEPQVSFNTGLTVLNVFSMNHRCHSIQVLLYLMFSVWTTGVVQYRFNCTWCFQHYEPQVSFNTDLTVLDVFSTMNHRCRSIQVLLYLMFSVWTTGVVQYRFYCTWCFQYEPQVSFNTGLIVLDVFSMNHRCHSIQV